MSSGHDFLARRLRGPSGDPVDGGLSLCRSPSLKKRLTQATAGADDCLWLVGAGFKVEVTVVRPLCRQVCRHPLRLSR